MTKATHNQGFHWIGHKAGLPVNPDVMRVK